MVKLRHKDTGEIVTDVLEHASSDMIGLGWKWFKKSYYYNTLMSYNISGWEEVKEKKWVRTELPEGYRINQVILPENGVYYYIEKEVEV